MKKVAFILICFFSLVMCKPAITYSQDKPPTESVASTQERADCVAAAISTPATAESENPCPDAVIVNGIEPGSKWSNIGWILLGTFLYFTMLYKMKKWKFPSTIGSVAIWLTDNWPNLVFFVVGVGLYLYWNPAITPREAFALGIAPNFFIDFIQKFFEKSGSQT